MRRLGGVGLLLVACVAWAEPVAMSATEPEIAHVQSGTAIAVDEHGNTAEMTFGEGVVINAPGYEKLGRKVGELAFDLKATQAQNDKLKEQVDLLAAEPNTKVGHLILVVGGALVLGAAAGAGAVLLIKH